jgi:hypothetical protein
VTTVTCTIDGRPVDLTDWQADSSANWGYRSLTGKIPATCTWARQESAVTLWLEDGTELWAGTITQDPWGTTDGALNLRAEGYAARISASKTRMFYRHDGTEGWVNAEDDPHNYGGTEHEIDAEVRPSSLWIRLRKGEIITNGSFRGFVFWVEGAVITGVTWTHTANAGTGNDWRLTRATGPSGAGTTVADVAWVVGTVSTGAAVSGESDLISLTYRRSGATTAALGQTFFGRLSNLQVFGRLSDPTLTIDPTASEVVADVGADAGFDTAGVQTSSLAVMPLDWTEDHTSLLTYMSELTDWHWEAEGLSGPNHDGSPRLTFGPWATTWTGYQADGVTPDWEPQKRYNKVVVPFRYLSGVVGEGVAVPTVDPFPGKEVVFYADELEDSQQDSVQAQAAAEAQVEYRASARVAGRLKIGRVTSAAGEPASGYGVRPGHLINVADRADLGPQRVVAMTYRDKGDVTAEINDDFSVVRMLSELRSDRPSAKRKKKPRRKKQRR